MHECWSESDSLLGISCRQTREFGGVVKQTCCPVFDRRECFVESAVARKQSATSASKLSESVRQEDAGPAKVMCRLYFVTLCVNRRSSVSSLMQICMHVFVSISVHTQFFVCVP